ncbi:MAG: glycogen synthase GlgA [Gammaproteobacteria bacterium]|nr:MAG: glycogen synthase GlgA [Gammaproteobacteria bacterium]
MDILFCTSEAYPLIKTGGLADVSGSLPKALSAFGSDVRVILPAYPEVLERSVGLTSVARLTLVGATEPVEILAGRFNGSSIRLYLVNSPAHFRRPGNPYVQDDGSDWPDNAERFALFARAIVALALGQADTDWTPELVHCNDWQTGLVPALLSQHEARPATLFSIHNLSYQGLFPAETFTDLKLPDNLWSTDGLEFYNRLSFIKGGIAFADQVTTVSPTYAQEICNSTLGYGLEGLLQYRSASLTGILNGMDNDTWNPATDSFIEKTYNIHYLQHKLANKLALQRDHSLPLGAQPLLLGYIGRLVEQKGVDLILDMLDQLFQHPVQLVVLGSGDRALEKRLEDAAQRYPDQLSVHVWYDERLAHRIEAGADCLLMPSRYEPCGLNQMYSLAYGTVPIVHRTGGLADTVVDLNETSARDYTATGFSFDDETPEAVLDTCVRALSYFQASRFNWWKLVITGMKKDYSWPASAARYLELYRRMCGLKGSTAENPEHQVPLHGPVLQDTAQQETRIH